MTAIHLPPSFTGPSGPQGPQGPQGSAGPPVPFFTSLAARDAAIPSPVVGQQCVVDPGDGYPPYSYIYGVKWFGLPRGRIATGYNLSQIDCVALVNIVGITFSLIETRVIQVAGYLNAQQVTAQGTDRCQLLSSTSSQAWLFYGQVYGSGAVGIIGNGLLHYTPGAGSQTINMQGGASAGAMRVPAQAAKLDVIDLGTLN